MEFGDDDDDNDWDAQALDALEAQALHTYAATQTRSQFPLHRANGIEPGEQQLRTTSVDVSDIDVASLLEEKLRLEKLAQAKEGELLVLRSNIARTHAEHSEKLAAETRAGVAVRESLTKELQQLRDERVRLQTDLTFSRQEAKDAKLRAQQASHLASTQARSLPHQQPQFPNRAAFERDDSAGKTIHQPQQSNGRKRKRQSRSIPDADLDEFDLAEKRLNEARLALQQEALAQDGRLPQDDFVQTMLPSSPAQRVSSPPADNEILQEEVQPAHADISSTSLVWVDKFGVYSRIINTTHGCDTCISILNKARNTDQSTSDSIGEAVLDLLARSEQSETAEALSCRLAIFLKDKLGELDTIEHEITLNAVLRLLHIILELFPFAVAEQLVTLPSSRTQEGVDASGSLTDILVNLMKKHNNSVRLAGLSVLLELATSLTADASRLDAIRHALDANFCSSVLARDSDTEHRIVLLTLLARLAAEGTALHDAAETLNALSVSFERDDLALSALVSTRIRSAQCLFCVLVNQAGGLAEMRRSRHVVPRLVRRLPRDLDLLYAVQEGELRTRLLALIAMEVKLYHILLKDEDDPEEEVTAHPVEAGAARPTTGVTATTTSAAGQQAQQQQQQQSSTSEYHWRVPEIRACHLTAMTRLLYAEEQDGIDATTQDLAMDLLEMAVSPEEGNDIYEIMGGGI